MNSEHRKVEIEKEGTFSLLQGENVLSVLIRQDLFDASHCGGHGTCGRCAVRFLEGAPLPKPGDRRWFSPEKLREGWRLACLAYPTQDCKVELPKIKDEVFILDDMLLQSGTFASRGGKCVRTGCEGDGKQEEPEQEIVVAGDLGTTTIVLCLVDIKSNRVLDTFHAVNPQRKWGADVVSRMECALAGDAGELSNVVKGCIEQAVTNWIDEGYLIQRVILAGNTVMTHLYMGYDVAGLAAAPFVPKVSGAIETSVCGIACTFLPSISAFVGGDVLAGVMVCMEDMRQHKLDTALLIDLGTNGEMVLIQQGNMLATATAAGPAFEGGFGQRLYGSDVIAIVDQLLQKGRIDETGLMAAAFFEEGVPYEETVIRQQDIRSFQMAKAAVFAGIRILLEEGNIAPEAVQRVYLAGGFGYRLSVEAACNIGVLPSELEKSTGAVGNTALAGALMYGKQKYDKQAQDIVKRAKSINLAEMEHFNDYYLQAMELMRKGI